MFCPEEFRWTSRADVCDQLVRFLLQTHPRFSPSGVDRARDQAGALLSWIAVTPSAPALRQIACDPTEDQMVRVWALRGLALLDEALPSEDLVALMDDPQIGWDVDPDRPISPGGFYSRENFLEELLALCRSPEATAAVQQHLSRRTAVDRVALLFFLSPPWDHPASAVEAWLYEQWLRQDWLALDGIVEDGEPLNLQIASQTGYREPSRALLLERWRAARGTDRRWLLDKLPPDSIAALTRWASLNATERGELADALRLPYEALVSHFGSEALLLERVEAAFRAADAALQRHRRAEQLRQHLPIDDVSSLPGAEPVIRVLVDETGESYTQADLETRSLEEVLRSTDLTGALRVLEEWPDTGVDERIGALVVDQRLDLEVRDRLLQTLWKRDRGRAASVARAIAGRATDLPLSRRVLHGMAREPRREERDVLLWAAFEASDADCSYFALQALDALGELFGTAWRSRLNELSRSRNAFLRLQAIAARARRGDETDLPQLIRTATEAKGVCVRAVALRLLGEIDAVRFFDLLVRALMSDDELYEQYYTPAAEESAYALTRMGTPEAQTALLRGLLAASSHPVDTLLQSYFEAVVAREEGDSLPPDVILPIWRSARWPNLWW